MKKNTLALEATRTAEAGSWRVVNTDFGSLLVGIDGRSVGS
jgi:hypothetical protein